MTPDRDRFTQRVGVPGGGRTRLYAISAEILDGAALDVTEDRVLDRSTQ